MVFGPPSWVPAMSMDPPDSTPLCEFMLDERWGRRPFVISRAPFTCGISGDSFTIEEVKARVDALRKGLADEVEWRPNAGSEWDKVVAVFSVNTIDTLTLAWAVHSLSGILSPANAAYSEAELTYQLKSSGAKALFTCVPLLQIAKAAAQKAGIPPRHIYLLSLPGESRSGGSDGLKTLDDLLKHGQSLEPLEPLKWSKGQGKRQTAFLCYSSGTSGLPKGVMISHRNVIANVLQIAAFESQYRSVLKAAEKKDDGTEVVLGVLPQSHIYSLVVICHASVYRGDQVVNLPKFDFVQFLKSIDRFKINVLFLVPPIIIAMANNKTQMEKYDQSSVSAVFTGAAPLGAETASALQRQKPSWRIRQGYGLTETSTVISSTGHEDIWFGSCGSLLPGVCAKLVSAEGHEITRYDEAGELVVESPSVVLGYHNNAQATRETFVNGWMRTGDEAVFRRGPNGHEHMFIVDRIKELIKVKGMQVAPAELEAHILNHPSVSDCAVIPIPDERAGERPKAYVVKAASVGIEDNERLLKRDILKHVKDHKARHKWLDGGIEFIDAIPKSPSGKILRRLLRDKDKAKRQASKL